MKEMKNNVHQADPWIIRSLIRITTLIAGIVVLLLGGILTLTYQLYQEPSTNPPTVAASQEESPPTATPALLVEEGKDIKTGLLAGEGMQVVKSTCTACHSADLILQNRFTREGWHKKIVWMQQTQGLWDLGENEATILDYLAENYSPEAPKGRRIPLSNIEWYELTE